MAAVINTYGDGINMRANSFGYGTNAFIAGSNLYGAGNNFIASSELDASMAVRKLLRQFQWP